MAGLMVTDKNVCVPLSSVVFEAEVKGHVVGLQTTLRYSNDSDDPVEIVFRFPVEQSHAVVGLTAVVDGRRIEAQLKEKEEARAIYDDAIASGQTAALGEEKSGDVFSVSLGNLPPKKGAEVHLRLVGELPIDAEGGIRFSLPVSLKPRYTPSGLRDPLAPIQSDVTGPAGPADVKRASGPGVNAFAMTVRNAEAVEAVTSQTHSISCSREGGVVRVTLLEEDLEKDLVVLVAYKEPHRPAAVVEGRAMASGTGYLSGPAVMLSFYPQFPDVEATGEFLFLLDRSGSMAGTYINSAKETLILFLKSLTEGCYFNIIGFGTRYQSLFPSSVLYDQSSLGKAMSHVESVEADLGGTELLRPLEHIFSLKPLPGLPRQVFVLTDGSVSNTQQCIECVRKNGQAARCFTFGIGSGASTELVEGLAKAGGGTSELVKDGERMQAKVIRSLKRALQLAVTDVVIDFQVPAEYEVIQSPQTIPPIFNGEKLVVYGFLKPKATPLTHGTGVVVLKGRMQAAIIEDVISFDVDTNLSAFPSIHHLAGKALIKDWERGNKQKDDIVELSKEVGVVSSHTAFVAVDEGNKEPIRGAMKTWDVLQPARMATESEGSSGNVGSIQMQLHGNICSVMNQGEMLDSLADKAYVLSSSATRFQKSSKKSGGFFSGFFSSLFGRSAPASAEQSTDYCDTSLRDASLTEYGLDDTDSTSTASHPSSTYPQASQPQTTLSALVTLQLADGSWNLDENLTNQLCGKRCKELEEACPVKLVGVMARVWATLLALCVLEIKYTNKKEEWELVATKAEGWLKKQTLPSDLTLEQLRDNARKCV